MDSRTAGRYAGPLAILLALGGTLLATVASPTFAWSQNALSELGAATTAVGTDTTVFLFNGGLIAGAVVAMGFAWYLADVATTALERVTAGLFALTVASMGAVGLFPLTEPLHGPVAVAFFLGITLTLAVAGVASLRRGSTRSGVGYLLAAGAHLAGWIAWVAVGGPDALGIAVPELWGSVLFAAWVLVTARRRGRRPSAP